MDKYIVIYKQEINTQPLGLHIATFNKNLDQFEPAKFTPEQLQEIADNMNTQHTAKTCQG
jgi:hypothetical protein